MVETFTCAYYSCPQQVFVSLVTACVADLSIERNPPPNPSKVHNMPFSADTTDSSDFIFVGRGVGPEVGADRLEIVSKLGLQCCIIIIIIMMILL